MKSHLLIPLALALGIAGTAYGEAQNQNESLSEHHDQSASSAFAAETMEHVETNTYAVPETAGEEESDANPYLVDEQNREQYRQDMLREHNRRELLRNVRSTQTRQLEALLQEPENEQQVAQESIPLVPLEAPTPILDAAIPAIDGEEADRTAPAAEAQVDKEPEDTPAQEPS